MRKAIGVIGVLFLMATATAVLAVPAGAVTYPPSSCSLQLASGATATAGGSLGLTGSGFAADSFIALTVNGAPVGLAKASAAGTISTSVVVPTNATSPITVAALPGGCKVVVALSAATAVKPLAFTGSNSEPLVIAGLVALALGSVMIFGARRRSATRAAAEAVTVTV